MVTRIGSKKPVRLYLAEWREKKKLTQEVLAARMETTKSSISRWETGERDLTTPVLAALAEAMDIDVTDLFRHPDTPSADALLAGKPESIVKKAVKIVLSFIEDEKATGTEG